MHSHDGILLKKSSFVSFSAKIYPFTAGALMFRDTVKEEIEAWREACANPGTTQMVERHLLPRDEGIVTNTHSDQISIHIVRVT